ncbi:DUF552 domain-containing protein, partial [Bacillus paralicheniformis]|uniref:cell division protein SepF n=1 Tax=Bacillus paralicheniformis TaxID=1648923 RepID=UPI002843CE1D
DQAKIMLSCVGGKVYILGGDIQRMGADIFLGTPENVDFSGTISELIEEEHRGW